MNYKAIVSSMLDHGIVIRNMCEKDLDVVVKLGEATPEIKTGTDSPQFYSKETLSQWIRSRNGVLLVAEENSSLIGFSITAYNPDSKDGYLHCIIVRKEFQRRNAGSRMLTDTIKRLKRLGCNHVYSLTIDSNDKTLEFLKSHGFQVGREFHYVEKVIPQRESAF